VAELGKIYSRAVIYERRNVMRKNFIYAISLLLFTITSILVIPYICLAQEDGEDVVIGKYRTIHSKILNEERLLLIHLPRGYEDTELDYPVLYYLYGHDINNYFAEAVIVTEKYGSTGEIPPVIVVGVGNTNRYRDNLPLQNDGSMGGADNFIRFFSEELLPYINSNYRTKDFRIVVGPQAGAVFGLYTLLQKPELFNAYIVNNAFMAAPVISNLLMNKTETFFSRTPSLNRFFYMKCDSDEQEEKLEYARKFEKFMESNKPDKFRFTMNIEEPSGYFIKPTAIKKGLKTLFEEYKLPEQVTIETVNDLIKYYKDQSEKYGFDIDVPDLMLTFEGDKLTDRRKINEAIELFEYQMRLYSYSLNARWRLGEIYRNSGNFEKALYYYNEFLKIRPVDAAMVTRRKEMVERIIAGSAAYVIEKEINSAGIEAGLKKYREIKLNSDSKLYFNESEFNALGYRLLNSGSLDEAIEIFKMNVEICPESPNVYDSLGEAFMRLGNKEKAIKNYRRSLELNPDNENAQEMLKKLEKK